MNENNIRRVLRAIMVIDPKSLTSAGFNTSQSIMNSVFFFHTPLLSESCYRAIFPIYIALLVTKSLHIKTKTITACVFLYWHYFILHCWVNINFG